MSGLWRIHDFIRYTLQAYYRALFVLSDRFGRVHPVDWRERHNHWPKEPADRLGAPIVIEENVWIGTRAIILKGVHIGSGAVVGAGAVVTHDVPSAALVAGVPAKVIRETEAA